MTVAERLHAALCRLPPLRKRRPRPHPLAAYGRPADPGVIAGLPYVEFLALLHDARRPRTYFEIGTATGTSLDVARCRSVCVDPQFRLADGTAMQLRALFPMTSDAFFARADLAGIFPHGIDLAFLDGMHHFEYLYRDLMNTERFCHAGSVIVLHDCLPLNERMAARRFQRGPESEITRGAWAGDVWKLIPALQKYRPDLDIACVDCPPTGLVLVSRLNPASRSLARNYTRAVAEFGGLELASHGLRTLYSAFPMLDSRRLALTPDALATLANARR